MIILDSSAAIELLLRPDAVPDLATELSRNVPIYAPEIFELEVMNVLRKQVRDRHVSLERAGLALESIFQFGILSVETSLLAPRIWQLRENMTSYDASYIALAEMLAAPLYTQDKKFVQPRLHKAEIKLV